MGTPRYRYHLLTLRLPGNVERIISDLRSKLYRVTAATSTHALPPIIPLAYVPSVTRRERVDLLPQRDIAPIQVGSIEPVGDTLILRVDLKYCWVDWLRGIDAESVPSGFPAPLAGIFLGSSDLVERWSESARVATQELTNGSAPVPKRLSVLHVELILIQTQASDMWWQYVDWKVLWSKRIKLRRQTVAT